ncbi:protein YgfX [Halomonas sp. YLGW01]|uniref:protein YgfX n=1 Tax=Halomonas sp. YLGW01 TaxID=2773308 RepID=UPI0017803112|nr:protein YgfX [Halomonas sp. YLGW01]
MPKPPVTISIVPSRLSAGLHIGLALGALLITLLYASPWLLATAFLCLGVACWHQWRQRRGVWQLRFVDQGEAGGEWQARTADKPEWARRTLSCRYLGPWLVGLTLDGESHWLWPDSLTRTHGRVLRRLLLAGLADA